MIFTILPESFWNMLKTIDFLQIEFGSIFVSISWLVHVVPDDILGKRIPTLLLGQAESEQHHCICVQAAWQTLIDIGLGDTVIVVWKYSNC